MPLILPILLMTQAATASAPTVDDDRLTLCIEQAAKDAPGAILTANRWLTEATGVGRSKPQQCLAMASAYMLRWDAAEASFNAAIASAAPTDHLRIARLYTQAGNAALAGGAPERALGAFDKAVPGLSGEELGQLQLDRARALVALKREPEAGEALQQARTLAPQEPAAFLLSATLARRQKNYDPARQMIGIALRLSPSDPDILLEAGVIAMLSGDEPAARDAWTRAAANAGPGPLGEQARTYLGELGPPPASKPAPEGR